MIWFFYILAFLLILVIVILFTTLTIKINYKHHDDQDELDFRFEIWYGLIHYKKVVPMIKINKQNLGIEFKEENAKGQEKEKNLTIEDFEHILENAREIMRHVKGLRSIIKKFLTKINIVHFNLEGRIGTGDAATTGIMIGACWTVAGTLLRYICKYFSMKAVPILKIDPIFNRAVSNVHFNCIVRFRIGQAIRTVWKVLIYWRGGRIGNQQKSTNFLPKNKGKQTVT